MSLLMGRRGEDAEPVVIELRNGYLHLRLDDGEDVVIDFDDLLEVVLNLGRGGGAPAANVRDPLALSTEEVDDAA